MKGYLNGGRLHNTRLYTIKPMLSNRNSLHANYCLSACYINPSWQVSSSATLRDIAFVDDSYLWNFKADTVTSNNNLNQKFTIHKRGHYTFRKYWRPVLMPLHIDMLKSIHVFCTEENLSSSNGVFGFGNAKLSLASYWKAHVVIATPIRMFCHRLLHTLWNADSLFRRHFLLSKHQVSIDL